MPRRLAAQLERHSPATPEEAAHREAIVALLRTAERPFAADAWQPGHVTGSALVVTRDLSRVLLVHHGTLRRWLQPGGHMEPGETDPRVTAVREALEETGLAVGADPDPLDVDVHLIPPRGAAPAHRHYDVRYRCVVDRALPPCGLAGQEARWFARAELDALDLDTGMRRMLGKIGGTGADRRG